MKIDNRLILENSKSLNVLYVEDDNELRRSTSKLFSNFFNKVTIADDGQDGYEKYRAALDEDGNSYDIVITDINMPNMNGILMSEKIKRINGNQVIVIVTAFNEIAYLNNAIELGVNAFLTKPIKVEDLKDVLYRISQLVVDRKLVQKHYKQIEDKNMLTINQKDASGLNSVNDIVDDLQKNKELISKLWTDKQVVHERLESHLIDVEFFRTHYAMKVIEYFLNVIKGEAEVGNCPVVFIMLDFFKNKNLPLEDIFMICVLFKNTVTGYIFDRYSFNHLLFDDFSVILDRNFEGVIINYIKMKYEVKENTLPSTEPKVVKEEEVIAEDINYIEYVLEHDIYELQDLEDDIDSLAISVTNSSNLIVEDAVLLGNRIKKYGEILSNYPLFSELGRYIIKLGMNFSDNAQLLFDDKERMLNISALIEGFVNDLIIWRKEIFENNIEDSHFLDKSFFSNVDTIIMFIGYDESTSTNGKDDLDDMFF